jgi:hypothetical protein
MIYDSPAYGILFAHNTEALVTGLTITRALALRNALRTGAISNEWAWNRVA